MVSNGISKAQCLGVRVVYEIVASVVLTATLSAVVELSVAFSEELYFIPHSKKAVMRKNDKG